MVAHGYLQNVFTVFVRRLIECVYVNCGRNISHHICTAHFDATQNRLYCRNFYFLFVFSCLICVACEMGFGDVYWFALYLIFFLYCFSAVFSWRNAIDEYPLWVVRVIQLQENTQTNKNEAKHKQTRNTEFSECPETAGTKLRCIKVY